jgi:bifunctional NMN adenylyltransferase/nudix hydrolase
VKTAIYIGRFQPFHNGHLRAIEHALSQVDRVVILLGSSNSPRTVKNPFTVEERKAMIREALMEASLHRRVEFAELPDDYNETQWIASVLSIAQQHYADYILGYEKDASSYYLRSFPTLTLIQAPAPVQNEPVLSATEIRKILYSPEFPIDFLKGVLPHSMVTAVAFWKRSTTAGQMLAREWEFIEQYKKQWAAAPYPPTFVTVDAVVIQSGHVLMVRRKASPGKGLLALPGGFINQNERLKDAVIRELIEETNIAIPDMVLKARIAATEVFDAPDRSLRGRTITHAFLIRLTDDKALPSVKGGDDAEAAMWVPLSSLNPTQIYEDHLQIINTMAAK